MVDSPRNIRLTVFVNREEYDLLEAAKLDGVSLPATLRTAAMQRLTWLAENGKKQYPRRQQEASNIPYVQSRIKEVDGTTYDYSDSQ